MTLRTDAWPDLLRRRFLNRTDRLCFLAPWGKPCPVEAGDNLNAMLAAHLGGAAAPVRWVTKAGKTGTKTGRFRLGTYSPGQDGRTLFAVIDCDGGGRHGNPLANPLGVAMGIVAALRAMGIVAHLERSGSGTGWHVWVYFRTAVSATTVRRLLFAVVPKDAPLQNGKVADAASNHGLEIFPKQDRLDDDNPLGNQVWLPWWFGAADGANQFYRITDGGEVAPYDPEDFETVSEADLDRALRTIPGAKATQKKQTAKVFTYQATDVQSDREKALSALAGLKLARADGYHDWLRVGMALHSVDASTAMLDAWDLWSRSCPDKYGQGASRRSGGPSKATAYRWGRSSTWPNRTAGYTPPGYRPRP